MHMESICFEIRNISEAVRGRLCRVLYSYNPQHEDELELKEGEELLMLEAVEEGWCKGLLKDTVSTVS